ncbi:MAG TPA: hypothetical protein VKA08_09275, partial [Balneolales bacterium]|nr:hypothetical protein [Balneolales bacterium]
KYSAYARYAARSFLVNEKRIKRQFKKIKLGKSYLCDKNILLSKKEKLYSKVECVKKDYGL